MLQTWVFFSLVRILRISLNDQMGDKEERLGDVVRTGTEVVSETSAGGRGEERGRGGRDEDIECDVYMYSCYILYMYLFTIDHGRYAIRSTIQQKYVALAWFSYSLNHRLQSVTVFIVYSICTTSGDFDLYIQTIVSNYI